MMRRTTPRACTAAALRKELPPIDFTPPKYDGPSYEHLHSVRETYMHPVGKHLYSKPLLITSGKMQYLFDHEGKRYLDMFGGVSTMSVGHAHPRLVEAAKQQMERVNHLTVLYNDRAMLEFTDRLKNHLPDGGKDWVVWYTNSGSESNDFAYLLARAHTRNHHLVTVRNGYHGMSDGARNMVSTRGWKHPLYPSAPTIRGLLPNAYRGLLGTSVEDVPKYVAELKDQILCETPAVCGFIAERIQGIGGLYPLLDGYVPEVYKLIRSMGGVTISDEVQCGFGRLGRTFWGFELDADNVPDIITCGKSIGNGLPLGAVLAKRDVAESILGTAFFNTFGGNPVACAVANESLKIIEEEDYMAHNEAVGEQIKAGVRQLMAKHEIIGDVRGYGFMLGVEFVRDRATKAPASAEVVELLDEMRERGVLIGKGGPEGNILRLQGPYCASAADADYFVQALDESVTAVLDRQARARKATATAA